MFEISNDFLFEIGRIRAFRIAYEKREDACKFKSYDKKEQKQNCFDF